MLIDGENAVLGRLFTVVAKKALLGEKVDIINCDKIIVSGRREVVLGNYLAKKKRGVPRKGPYFPAVPEKFCKRVVRGMLPHKMDKGRDAMKRIMFYRGIPVEYAGKEAEKIAQSTLTIPFVTVAEICKFIGGKQ